MLHRHLTVSCKALHAILGSAGDETEVTMLYGSRTATDVLAKETLDAWCEPSPRWLCRVPWHVCAVPRMTSAML